MRSWKYGIVNEFRLSTIAITLWCNHIIYKSSITYIIESRQLVRGSGIAIIYNVSFRRTLFYVVLRSIDVHERCMSMNVKIIWSWFMNFIFLFFYLFTNNHSKKQNKKFSFHFDKLMTASKIVTFTIFWQFS